MKNKLWILLLTIVFAYSANAQTVKKVKITDVVKMVDTATAPLVVNFWATWCGPCVRELKYFEKVINAYKQKGVRVILVSLDYADEFPNGIAGFAKNNGYTSELWWLDEADPNYFCSKIDANWQASIPVTLMVNNAKQYRKFYADQLLESHLKTALDKLTE